MTLPDPYKRKFVRAMDGTNSQPEKRNEMKITTETNIRNFKAWSGAIDTQERIIKENKEEEFESYIEELYPDGLTDTQLNDLLWFEEESIFEYLGIEKE